MNHRNKLRIRSRPPNSSENADAKRIKQFRKDNEVKWQK